MANDYYNPTGAPASSSTGWSDTVRGEFANIGDAMEKLATITGNAGKIIAINASGTKQEAKAAIDVRTLLELIHGSDVLYLPGVAGGQTAYGDTEDYGKIYIFGTKHANANGGVMLNSTGGAVVIGTAEYDYTKGLVLACTTLAAFYMYNKTASDADAGRACSIYLSGIKSGGTESQRKVMTKLTAEHDGTGADTKARFIISIDKGAGYVEEMCRWGSNGDCDMTSDLDVTGALTKGSGSFLIDHPLDPTNKLLKYGFTESPRYDLIHRGVAKLKDGIARVDIDAEYGLTQGTFEALTQNAVVTSIQPIDSFENVKCSPVTGNGFTITSADNKSESMVSWVVIAERNDPFVLNCSETDSEGHLINEIDKDDPTGYELADTFDETENPKEVGEKTVQVNLKTVKGFYRHPVEYGQKIPTKKVINALRVKNGK